MVATPIKESSAHISKRTTRPLAALALLTVLASGCDQAKEQADRKAVDSAPTATATNQGTASQRNDPWAPEAPSPSWRLVLADKFNHVLAPLPGSKAECERPMDAEFSRDADKPFAMVHVPESIPPAVDATLWPKDRKWKVVQLDGTTLTTSLNRRMFIVSDINAGCQYLASESVGATGTPEANVGMPSPAIAYAQQSSLPGPLRFPVVHRRQRREGWPLGQAVSQPILQKVAAAVEAAGMPDAFKAQWSEIATDPDYFSVVRERRREGESDLALAVWRLPTDLGNGKPLWVLARETSSGFQIISAPKIADDSYHFLPLLWAATDVDGDGNDELIVLSVYYEGNDYSVWSLADGRIRVLARTPYFGL